MYQKLKKHLPATFDVHLCHVNISDVQKATNPVHLPFITDYSGLEDREV
jgi:hypothetical protein